MTDLVLRYAVTAWDNFYPSGGLDNVKARFATLDEAIAFAHDDSLIAEDWVYDNVVVYDLINFTCVLRVR